MTPEYDAILVGARCAGAATAMLLARKGYRVLAVDKATFPSDTLSTHFIHPPGVASLKRWGLLGEVQASKCPPIPRSVLTLGDLRLVAAPPPIDGIADAYCVRRTVLDDILVRAAAASGADVRQAFRVESVERDGARVTGMRGQGRDGVTVTEHARVVIGADGMHSHVARAVGAPAYDQHPTLTCAYYSYWSGVELDGAELYPLPGRMIIAAPTNDGQIFTIVYWPAGEFHQVRANVEGAFMAALDLVPGLADRLRAGARAERFRGTGHLPNFFRRPHGDGWALVGDAGYHKDPILALGITDAFRDAELLAEALHAEFTGREPRGVALAAYEQRRNAAAAQSYANTIQFASLEPPPPEMLGLLAALAADPDAASQFMGTVIGTVPAETFFAPENLARIMRSGLPAG